MAYMGTDYYPQWLDNLADDVTLEAAAMDGTAHGVEDVGAIMVVARQQYENQVFSYAGPAATTASSRTTPLKSAASPLELSSSSRTTRRGRPSASW